MVFSGVNISGKEIPHLSIIPAELCQVIPGQLYANPVKHNFQETYNTHIQYPDIFSNRLHFQDQLKKCCRMIYDITVIGPIFKLSSKNAAEGHTGVEYVTRCDTTSG